MSSALCTSIDKRVRTGALRLNEDQMLPYKLLYDNKDRYSSKDYFDRFCDILLGCYSDKEDPSLQPVAHRLFREEQLRKEKLARKINALRKLILK